MCQKRCAVSTQIISHCAGRQGLRCHHCKCEAAACMVGMLVQIAQVTGVGAGLTSESAHIWHYITHRGWWPSPKVARSSCRMQTLCPLKLGKPVSIMIPWWLFHKLSRSSLHFSWPVWSLIKWREGRPTAEEHFNDSWEHACGALNIWVWLINGSFHD